MTADASGVAERYRHLLYAKGFLLGSSGVTVPDHWVVTALAGLPFAYDPRHTLSIGRSGAAEVAVFGTLLDPERGIADAADIARHLAESLDVSREMFNVNVERMVGRYVLIAGDALETTIQSDAGGLSAIYYCPESGVCGSHARLVAAASGLQDANTSFSSPVWETGDSVSYLPGLVTIFAGVLQLTPNTELRVPSMRVRRVFPRASLGTRQVMEAVDALTPLLDSQVALLGDLSGDLLVSLTAGIDSRTTLAIMRPILERIRLFTYTPMFGRFAELPIVQTDQVAARSMAHALGVGLSEALIDDDRVEEELRSILEVNVHHEHIWPLAKWYLKHLPSGTLHVRSNLYEIGRAFYRKGKPRNLPLTPDVMARTHRGRSPSVREATQAFEEFVNVTGFEVFDGYDPYDLFYWEHRMGRWHSQVVAESDLSHDTWVLLNSRQMFQILLSVPVEDRLAASVYRALIRRNWPELMRWPINAVTRETYRGTATVIEAGESDSGRISLNDDRISEVYKGEIGAEEAQALERRRVDWMTRQARGDRVLDLGCSQGIASILLGREGFEVAGVDVQASRIEYAAADLVLETDATQRRVKFIVGEGSALEFEDDYFDTVLLGNVIEHLAVPERVLSEVQRVLHPDGIVVISTPFGALRHGNQQHTFFPKELVALVSEWFGIVSGDVVDGFFRVIGQKGIQTAPEVEEALNESVSRAIRREQEELADLRTSWQQVSSALEEARQVGARLEKQSALFERRVAQAQESKEKYETAWRKAKDDLSSVRSELASVSDALSNAIRANTELQVQYESTSAELKRASEQIRIASQASESLARTRRQLARLEAENEKLRHRIAIGDWKFASLTQRRWWRLGTELGTVRRRPLAIFSLPSRILKVLRSRAPRLPRPVPAERQEEGPPDRSPPLEFGFAEVVKRAAAVIPRRDRAAATVVGSQLGEYLAHEFEVFQLSGESWEEQILRLAPSCLIVESGAPDLLGFDIDSMLVAAARIGATTILWDTRSEALSPPLKARFDVICGDGKPPTDDYGGKLIERRGFVQPRLHNPIGAHRRRKDVNSVELDSRVLGQTTFDGITRLVEEAKNYKLLRAIGLGEETAAPLVASATPLIVMGAGPEYGLSTQTEEEAASLEKSLLRSGVLRARLSHPQMRTVMRERSIGRDLDLALGAPNEGTPPIDVMVATKRPEKLEAIFDNLGRQSYPNFSVWLVAHGIALDGGRVQDLAAKVGVNLSSVVEVDESVILGEVFNIGFGETQAEIIAKMDDDDFYGSEYLWDLYTALDFSGAEVAGKWAHYAYLEGVDSTIYRFKHYEHRYTEVVAISTLLMHRDVLSVERFPAMPWGSGSVFLRALGAQGGRVFAADRWNYLYIRAQDGARNTFPISDMKMLANSEVVCRGLNLAEVTV